MTSPECPHGLASSVQVQGGHQVVCGSPRAGETYGFLLFERCAGKLQLNSGSLVLKFDGLPQIGALSEDLRGTQILSRGEDPHRARRPARRG